MTHADNLDLAAVREYLRAFAHDRDWEQFHTPKNLAMALAGEVGELLAVLQWLTAEESSTIMREESKAAAIREELGDILQYVIRLADVLDVDLSSALWDKLHKNETKYPIELARGTAKKYTEF